MALIYTRLLDGRRRAEAGSYPLVTVAIPRTASAPQRRVLALSAAAPQKENSAVKVRSTLFVRAASERGPVLSYGRRPRGGAARHMACQGGLERNSCIKPALHRQPVYTTACMAGMRAIVWRSSVSPRVYALCDDAPPLVLLSGAVCHLGWGGLGVRVHVRPRPGVPENTEAG
jgi:hypothetical protein